MRWDWRRGGLYGVLLVACAGFALVVSGHGRGLWYPLYRKLAGSPTEADLLAGIKARKPGLDLIPLTGDVHLIAYKQERELEIWSSGKLITTIPVLAASGHLGPKMKSGDRQVPEGIYPIDALNPASSFYLSLRVGYPNAEDRARSQQQGIHDFGGDIYIHGKDVSIGCLALGDDRIEDVYFLVAKAGLSRTQLIIAPTRHIMEANFHRDAAWQELDRHLSDAIRQAQLARP